MMKPETKNRQEMEEREENMLRMIKSLTSKEMHELQISPEVLALEEINQICEESTDPPLITKLRQLAENKGELMSKMTCLSCKRFPAPDKRFICPKGHILCAECGRDNEENHEFKCLVRYEVGDDEEIKKRTGLARISQKNFKLCHLTLRPCSSDPIYIGFWHSATWRCQFNGCKEEFPGTNLYVHVAECPYKNAKRMQKKLEEAMMSEEQDERLIMQMQRTTQVGALERKKKNQDTMVGYLIVEPSTVVPGSNKSQGDVQMAKEVKFTEEMDSSNNQAD